MLKPYLSLKNYLERRTILKVGKLHIRLHNIKSEDITPFLHSHPFSYISIILKGSYIETLESGDYKRNKFNILFRKYNTYHRLKSVNPNTLTLFIAWTTKDNKWSFKDTGEKTTKWTTYPKGVYLRQFKTRKRYCKFDKYWYKSSDCPLKALVETQPSINQNAKISPMNS